MRTSGLSRYALFACCVAIAACSQATPLSHFQFTPNGSVVPDRRATPLSYSVLYSFGEPLQGSEPNDGLISVGGLLYGTTENGGNYGYGTVFSFTKGKETVLHSFGSFSNDGEHPYEGLIDVGGTLYGTTRFGGKYGDGTVFSITTSGTAEKVLHSFGSFSNDGLSPYAGLTDVGGTLYGTTQSGGKYGGGTVFSITTGGVENVLWSFGNGSDGKGPDASLLDVKGTLYGTTTEGGKYCVGSGLCGTVFSITTSGTEKVLHSFGKGSDGAFPGAGLIDEGGATLYGTTEEGGAYTSCSSNVLTCGTVFSITTGGTENVLYSFHGPPGDGAFPYAGLLYVGGTLYGTTFLGGQRNLGTLFKIPQFGAERVLHSFGNGSDGSLVVGGLLDVGGTLYGTTDGGGQFAHGTVYTQSP
jgi:uncharacterized repeat protein (TIGR03803 family)